jgi:hypothetical protein
MGDVDNRNPFAVQQRYKFLLQFQAQGTIQGSQRFVQH